MGFADAVKSVFNQYAGFSGRARRSEYWWFTLFTMLASVVASIVDAVVGFPVGTIALLLAILLPSLAVSVRRLHDTGRSGWWLLIGLIPLVGFIILIVFYVQDSQPGTNAHGPSPKESAFA